jgi:DNA-binding NarL/FixJ family response regulator
MRIQIIHMDRVVRESVALALERETDLTVVGLSDGQDGAALLGGPGGHAADVVVLDLAVVAMHGCETIRSMAAGAHARVLVIGVPDRDPEILAVIEAGAAGYVTRDASLSDLVASIRALARGQAVCSPRVVNLLFARVSALHESRSHHDARGNAPQLTRRELQVIALIEAGLTNKEIARRLTVEVQTVKNHVHNVLDKLHMRNRIEAARYARTQGLLSSGTSTS